MGASTIRQILKTSLIALLLGVAAQNASAIRPLSTRAKVSILTCEPSDDAVYTRFGHAAFRVVDDSLKFDFVFNYGVFSFDQPAFIPRFVAGKTDYELGVSYADDFFASYARRGSNILEQTLNFSNSEKQKLWKALWKNLEKENRTYRYNFIFDNCATRLCDMILLATDGNLVWGGVQNSTSYRELLNEFFGENSWYGFGCNLLFGRQADEKIGFQNEDLFLPMKLRHRAKTAVIVSETAVRDLLSADFTHQTAPRKSKPLPIFLTPNFIFSALLVLVLILTFLEFRRKISLRFLDIFLFATLGLLGFLLAFLMFFSLHPLVKNNLNFLFLQPLNFLFAVLLFFPKLRPKLRFYQIINAILMLIWIICFAFKIQGFEPATLPLVITIFLRVIAGMKNLNRC